MDKGDTVEFCFHAAYQADETGRLVCPGCRRSKAEIERGKE